MDDLSTLLFGRNDVNVTMVDAPRFSVEQIEQALFGASLDSGVYAELVGAPDDSVVTVVADSAGKYLTLLTDNESLFAETQLRRIALLGNRLVMYNDNFVLLDDAPVGVGTRILARQVRAVANRGITQLLATASGSFGDPDYNGYYVWVRLGFNAMLSNAFKTRLQGEGFGIVEDTNQLIRLPGGSRWWQRNGVQSRAVFDTDPESPMRDILNQYLQEQEIMPYD